MEDINKMQRWARGEFTKEDLEEAQKINEARKKMQERGIVGITGLPTSKAGMMAYGKKYLDRQRKLDRELGLNDKSEFSVIKITIAVVTVLIILYAMFS